MNNKTREILKELSDIKSELKQGQNNSKMILKELSNVETKLTNIKKQQDYSFLPSLTFFLMSLGMSLIIYATNKLTSGMNEIIVTIGYWVIIIVGLIIIFAGPYVNYSMQKEKR